MPVAKARARHPPQRWIGSLLLHDTPSRHGHPAALAGTDGLLGKDETEKPGRDFVGFTANAAAAGGPGLYER